MTIKRKVVAGDELYSALKKGIDTLADTVKTTMGPKGKLVLIQRPGKHPIVTKDGVTVAQSIELTDEVQNLGAQIIKESAARTADEAGDGTTTATVLAQSIFTEGLRMISAGFDRVGIKAGLNKGLHHVQELIENNSKKIESLDDLTQVALISANGEEEIAKLIVSAIDASGVDGHVIVEEAKGFKSTLTVVDGYQIERGFLSPYFVTDKNSMNCTFIDPLILVADRSFTSIHDLMKPLEIALDSSRPILVIANDIEGDAMQGLVLNKVKGSLNLCAIKSPGYGAARHELLADLESVVGGQVINASFDMSNFTMDMFATCKKVIIDKSTTLFVNDKTNKNEKLCERISTIKQKKTEPTLSDDERLLYDYRLKQLAGSIAILRVGAATESELIERYDRVDDALNATKAALQEGILAGGGVALARAAIELQELSKTIENQNVRAGVDILSTACSQPFKQIIANSNKGPDLLLEKILSLDADTGYDSRLDKIGNMFELGVVDPKKVVRCALENAVSASSMLLSAGASMIEVSKNDSQ